MRRKDLCQLQTWLDLVPLKPDVNHLHIIGTIKVLKFKIFVIFLIGIYSMQGWTAATRHGVARRRSSKWLKHTGNLFTKNLELELIGVC